MNLSMPVALPELLAHMPNGLVVLDQHGVVMAHNDAALLLLATPQHDWDGREFLDVIAGSPLEIDLRMLLAPPAAAAMRDLICQRAGGARVIELQLSPLHADDTHDGALLVVRDRTDRIQLEQLRAQRAAEISVLSQLARVANAARTTDALLHTIICELARIAPAVRVVFSLLQTDGTPLRLVSNEQLCDAPTLESQALIDYDSTWLQHILRANRPCIISVADAWLARTPIQAYLQQAGMRTVLAAPLATSAAPLGAMFVGHVDQRTMGPNEVQLFMSIGELIAEALDRTRHAEEALRARSMALATVGHELRAPLGSIIGFIELLEDGVFGELPAQIHEPLALMRYSGLALLRLINDLRDFSKIEADYQPIALESVDLATVIRDVVGALQPQLKKRGLAVQVAIAPALPLVYANSARLAQVLTNLLSNAIKFTDHGSITVRALADGERVRFSVADTGIGIAPQQQHIVFQEFRQIDNEHTRRYSGSGLGLAISRKLMQRMGGTLTMESTLGVGSTFYGEVSIVRKSPRETGQSGAST
jgi:signal transduction histidine kinase